MIDKKVLSEKVNLLYSFAMYYEIAVISFFGDDYLQEFYDFYEIRNRQAKLVPSERSFCESLKEVGGDDVWRPVADKAEELFGLPSKVTVFDDNTVLREELGGRRGLSPFFFVFDLMFCEYEDFTLCFVSGTNN